MAWTISFMYAKLILLAYLLNEISRCKVTTYM